MLIAAWIMIGWAVVLAIFKGPRTPLSTVLYDISPGVLNGFQAGIYRYIGAEPWDWIFVPILEQPCWLGPIFFAGLLILARGVMQRRAW